MFAAIAIGVVGAGLSLYEQNQARKQQQAAQQAQQQDFTIEKEVAVNNAGLMKIGAQSNLEAATTRSGIEGINAQLKYDYAVNQAEMSRVGMQMQTEDIKGQAAVNQIRASGMVAALTAGAAIDQLHARFEGLQAQSSLLQGQQREQASDEAFAMQKSTETAKLAAGNIDMSVGTSAAVRTSIDVVSAQQAIIIQQRAAMDAFGHNVNAMADNMSAAGKLGEAAMTQEGATVTTALADSKSTAMLKISDANVDLAKALASAGLSNDKAIIGYSLGMAGIDYNNKVAQAGTSLAVASAINPHSVDAAPLLNELTSITNAGFSLYKSGAFDKIGNLFDGSGSGMPTQSDGSKGYGAGGGFYDFNTGSYTNNMPVFETPSFSINGP